jgi:hypothetical protein
MVIWLVRDRLPDIRCPASLPACSCSAIPAIRSPRLRCRICTSSASDFTSSHFPYRSDLVVYRGRTHCQLPISHCLLPFVLRGPFPIPTPHSHLLFVYSW